MTLSHAARTLTRSEEMGVRLASFISLMSAS